jgi:hypothetical protein
MSTLMKDASPKDFRFLLLHMLQWQIYQIIVGGADHWFKNAMILNNVINPDCARAVAWTSNFSVAAQEHKKDMDQQRIGKRPVLF